MPDTDTLTGDQLREQALDKIQQAQTVTKAANEAGRDFTDAERTRVTSLFEEARDLKKKGDTLDGDGSLRSQVDELGLGLEGFKTGPRLPSTARDPRKTLGQRFVDDERIKAWMEHIAPAGRMPSEKTRVESPAIEMGGFKDIVAGGDPATAGPLVWPDFLGLQDQGLYRRPLRIRQLLSSGTTTSDTVEFVRELVPGISNDAEVVPEARGTSAGTGSGDVIGTKPESDYQLERVTEPVKTLAHWLPATKRALADAAQVQTLIDTFLQYGLEEKLEDQVVAGNGTGENFTGILATSGVQACGSADVTASDPGVHTALAGIVALRVAKRKVLIGGRAIATAHVLNPIDNEKIDLARDTVGQFYFGGPGGNSTGTAWGIPRVESEAVPAGIAITADFRRGIIWDREQATVAVSDSHADFFIRNLVAILAELRLAFGIFRPSAFCVTDIHEVFAM